MVGEFEYIEPMKPHTSSVEFLEQVSDDPEWAVGEKLDGFREVLYLGKAWNHMLSSLGNDHISKCPQFQVVVPELAGTVLDCEGLSPTRMLEDNAACFKADSVNAIAWQKTHGDATLVVFDCLAYKGEEVWQKPFVQRRAFLEDVVVRYLRHMIPVKIEELWFTDKLAYWKSIVKRTQAEGHEGVILKRMDARYEPGKRSGAWLKVKREETLVCRITGYIGGIGKFQDMVGSLAFEAKGGIRGYTSGMDDSTREDMTRNFESRYKGKRCYIKCQEITRAGALRHSRYQGLVEEEKYDIYKV